MFATAGDAVEAMRGQLQTLAGARARANMFVDESDLVHHFRMQESKAGHVSRADFAKVLVQVFPTLPLALSFIPPSPGVMAFLKRLEAEPGSGPLLADHHYYLNFQAAFGVPEP